MTITHDRDHDTDGLERALDDVEIIRRSPHIGTEIRGLDLTSLDDAATAALRREFAARKVLVFRDVDLSPAQHVDAVSIFDEPFDHPTAVRHPDHRLVYPYEVRTTGKASRWHVGGLWRDPVFGIESLVYEVVPETGGDTIWADLQAAYDDLSAPIKDLVTRVGVLYDANPSNYAQGATRAPVADTIEHALVYDNPRNGRRGLFLSTSGVGFTGVSPSEGAALVDFLAEHASQPKYQARFGWAVGDFVLWDNRATWHVAVDDYGDAPRAYRKVIAG